MWTRLQWLLFLAAFSRASNSSLEYDYVIIGGGTAGLTLANRLSELPDIQVAVIEAGDNVESNPNVLNPDGYVALQGSALDWQYVTANQAHALDRSMPYPAGKALGGTSAINGMIYLRAEKSQIDAWESLGNPGWNWDSLFSYYRKSENFTIPTSEQLETGSSYNLAYHGQDGPVKTGNLYTLLNETLYQTMATTWETLGVPPNQDPNGGSMHGFTVWPSTVDQAANVRDDSAQAYYYPFQSRSNLHVFANTTAQRITWKDGANSSDPSDVVADGVEVSTAPGYVSVLKARKEVIVSAGSVRTPAILELSGVGNPAILNQYGIPVVVDLPTVGENFQDQTSATFKFNPTGASYSGRAQYVSYSSLADFMPGSQGLDISATAQIVAASTNLSAAALTQILNLQYNALTSGNVSDAEVILTVFFDGTLANGFWVTVPFSRGSVHIASNNPYADPLINPNFFLVDYDIQTATALSKFLRRFWSTAPVSEVAVETTPGFDTVPVNATDEQWADWLRSSSGVASHPIGTAAMMSRELGGVVDSRLKVYGTGNVRVCDASVIPLQVSGHLMSTVYAVAEKGSDLIKEDLQT